MLFRSHRLVEVLHAREDTERLAKKRAEWTAVRAGIHQALAARGSRVALYDLRETIEGARTPLPVEFLAALSAIGDRSCLDAIAAAYAKGRQSHQGRSDWWQRHLAEAFRTIVKRERMTMKHAAIKRVRARWPDVDRILAGPSGER